MKTGEERKKRMRHWRGRILFVWGVTGIEGLRGYVQKHTRGESVSCLNEETGRYVGD